MLETLKEEGNLHPQSFCGSRRQRGEGPLLGATRPVQSSAVVQRLPPQAVVGSRRRPQAASRLGDGFRRRHPAACLQRRRPASEGLSRLVALAILLREGKVVGPVKGSGKSVGGLGLNCAGKGAAVRGNARIGCSRVCPCVGNEVAEVDRRQSGSEKRVSAPREKIAERDDARGREPSLR